MIGLPGRDGNDAYNSFVAEYGLDTITQIPDSDNELWRTYGVRSQPAWVLVRADGSSDIGFGAIPDEILSAAAGA